jgi:hypothetical protein
MSNDIIEDDKTTIDVFIKTLDDLYNDSNYNTLRDNTLNSKLDKYLLNCARNYKLNKRITIVIHIPTNLMSNDISNIKKIFIYHFSLKIKETELQLKQKFRQWKINLFIGATFLCLCFILLEWFSNESNMKIIKMFRESLLIVGWVALWEPISFILFGWHPIVKKKLYYKKLMNSPISIQRYMSKTNSKNITC